MEIELNKSQFKELLAKATEDELTDELGFDKIESRARMAGATSAPFKVDDLSLKLLDCVKSFLKSKSHMDYRQMVGYVKLRNSPEMQIVDDLRDFPQALKDYLYKLGLDQGWVFMNSPGMKPMAYLLVNVEYKPEDRRNRYFDPARVFIELAANSKFSFDSDTVTLSSKDMKKTVPQILLDHGLMPESKELLEMYDEYDKRYRKILEDQAEQYWCRGVAALEDDDSNRWRWWSKAETTDLSPGRKPTKCVIDHEALTIDRDYDHHAERFDYESTFWGKTCKVPTHPMLYCFHVLHQKYFWIQSRRLKKYKYDENIEDKLILPKEHANLITALCSSIFIPKKDDEGQERSKVIAAKTKSTLILAVGSPGLGKTLSAEVYSEKMKRPLYEIHSGILGIEPKALADNLRKILARAKRLKMPVVINEADVYIRKRGNDIVQNAIMSTFLTTFEYHDGLVFMTTNRENDVDDALESRCLAIIRYKLPSKEEAKKIWQSHAHEFDFEIPDKIIDKLVDRIVSPSGRDIMNLMRLVKRVVDGGGAELSVSTFLNMAPFRGLTVKE